MAGYNVTHLVEIARELGVWDALTRNPGRISSELAETLGVDAFYTDVLCRTAFSFGLLDRDGDGWRMAPHFDQILGNPESIFYLAHAPRAHMVVGEDYRQYVQQFRAGTTTSYQHHDENFMREVAEALKRLPRIVLDVVLPRLPELDARLKAGARVLDVECGGGWAIVQIAERFPSSRCVGMARKDSTWLGLWEVDTRREPVLTALDDQERRITSAAGRGRCGWPRARSCRSMTSSSRR